MKASTFCATLLILFILCASAIYTHAQNYAAPVETRKGWGYIKPDSTWLIEPMFSDYWRGNLFQFNSDGQPKVMGDFHDGMLRVRMHGDWGFYDNHGHQAITPKFDIAKDFSDGLALVKEGKKWGFINKRGEWVILPIYTNAQSFSNGFAAVEVDGKKWGFVNKTAKLVLPAIYRHAKKFSQGFAAVEIENNRWTYVDSTGSQLTEPIFDNAFSFTEGMGRVIQNGIEGFIDLTGKLVIPCKYELATPFKGGVARVKNANWFFIDKSGNRISDKVFLNAGDFHEGLCRVRTEAGWGFINTDGSWAIEASSKYQGAGDFSGGIGRVRLGWDWKFINKKGNILFPELKFDRAENFSQGYARITTVDGWGIINSSGKIVLAPQFKHMYSFVNINDTSSADEQQQDQKEDE